MLATHTHTLHGWQHQPVQKPPLGCILLKWPPSPSVQNHHWDVYFSWNPPPLYKTTTGMYTLTPPPPYKTTTGMYTSKPPPPPPPPPPPCWSSGVTEKESKVRWSVPWPHSCLPPCASPAGSQHVCVYKLTSHINTGNNWRIVLLTFVNQHSVHGF